MSVTLDDKYTANSGRIYLSGIVDRGKFVTVVRPNLSLRH